MITQPKQERSRRSHDSLVAAASSLLTDKSFEALTLREICDRAGLTSGAFYARFSKKEDLALAMADQLGDEFHRHLIEFSRRLADAGFEPAVRALLQDSVDLYRRRAGDLRAVIAVAGAHPPVALALRRTNDRAFAELAGALEPYRSTVGHPAPDRALSLGFLTVFNTLRELVLEQKLFEEAPIPFEDEVLVDELLRMLMAYLQIDSAGPRTRQGGDHV